MNGVAPEQRVVRKRALTEELVAIRTQKADVLRQIEQIAKRQKTGGLPTKASELLAGNNKLVLQMEQRNRAEKVRAAPHDCNCRRWPAMGASTAPCGWRCAPPFRGCCLWPATQQPHMHMSFQLLNAVCRRLSRLLAAAHAGAWHSHLIACSRLRLIIFTLVPADVGRLRQDSAGPAEEPADQDVLWGACEGELRAKLLLSD
jgi:hypothetical protein